MASNARHGNADASKDPALAAHWAFVSVQIAAQVGLSFLTQYHLYGLLRKRVKVQIIGHPFEIDLILFSTILMPIIGLLQNGANAGIHCSLYVAWPHIMVATFISVLMYRSLRFAHRLSQVETTKHYIRQGMVEEQIMTKTQIKQLAYARWGVKYLTRTRVMVGSIIVGFVLAGPLWFANPSNVRYAQGEPAECYATTSLYALLGWFFWVLPFVCFLRGFEFNDPYQILFKLQTETIMMTIVTITFLIVVSWIEQLGTSQSALVLFDVGSMFTFTFWYTESYFPLQLTWKRLEESKRSGAINIKMIDVLANPQLLQLFEDHLIKEWAIENLEFYKSVVLFRIIANREYKRLMDLGKKDKDGTIFSENVETIFGSVATNALQIYEKHIAHDAPQEVNLPNSASRPIHDLFQDPLISRVRLLGLGHAMSHRPSSVANFSLVPKEAEDNKENQPRKDSLAFKPTTPIRLDDTGTPELSQTRAVSGTRDIEKGERFLDSSASLAPSKARGGVDISLASLGESSKPTIQTESKPMLPGMVARRRSSSRTRSERPAYLVDIKAEYGVSDVKVETPTRKRKESFVYRRRSNRNFCKNIQGAKDVHVELKGLIADIEVTENSVEDTLEKAMLSKLRQLMRVFDDAETDVYNLLKTDSFRRFRAMPKFQAILRMQNSL